MYKILVLGATGMLGNAVVKHFAQSGHAEITATYRTGGLLHGIDTVKFDVLTDTLKQLPTPFDYVINCIGVIKPYMASLMPEAVEINAVFPWRLAAWCAENGARLIHITTDCVYSGKKGQYVETDPHDALDDYGKSKSLGECKNAMVLRTSIIGEELHKFASLLSWAKKQKGKTVDGFSTHWWNGLTTQTYAHVCDTIISQNLYQAGLFHVFAKDDVTKLQMMNYFNKKFSLGLTIEERCPEPVNRTLRTQKALCAQLNIPTVEEMIMTMER